MIVINKRPYQLKNSAVCIGKFDGLHRGHQSLIEELSRFSDCNKVLFTFAFSKAPYILSPEEKRKLKNWGLILMLSALSMSR